jgi:hypothetical protein
VGDLGGAAGKLIEVYRPGGALKLILEAIFEADFCPNSYGFRPQRSPHQALAEVRRSVLRRMSTVIDVDLTKYLDAVRHSVPLDRIAKRVQDPEIMHLVKQTITDCLINNAMFMAKKEEVQIGGCSRADAVGIGGACASS